MTTLTADAIVGSWHLVRWSIEYPDGRPPALPFGADALGLIVYAPDGWMTATMCRRRRAGLSASTAAGASSESKARAFDEYLSYGGRWHVDGDVVVHEVMVSMNPALLGVPQRRLARLDATGTHLDLVAEERDAASGRSRLHRIAWMRKIDRKIDRI
ncbi:MAG: lipocalin-like domain-containing protein [Gammaproteobacteria bacterium]|nr:lipocalin-like domain-containing protein [Gammaproteobacteria bacterium]